MRSAALLLLASCHWAAGGFGRTGSRGDDDGEIVYTPECHENVRPGAAQAPAKPAEASPDFAKLGAYRSYFRVTHVGELADHFAIFFGCVEESIAVYGVAADGTVRFESGGFGGIGIRSGQPGLVPAEKQALAAKALAQLNVDYQGASGASVKYLGGYREVTVEELMPVTAPGDPYKRMTWYQRAIVPMNADLTAFAGKPGLEGGETLLCWHDANVIDCGDARWMDFAIAPIGAPQLAALLTDGSPAAPADRTRFAAALAAAAKGAAPITTDALLARQGDGLLPAGFSTPLAAGFQLTPDGGKPVPLRVALSAAQIAHGHAEGKATATIGGAVFTLAIDATPEPAVTADGAAEAAAPGGLTTRGDGAAKLRVHFRYRLDDGRGAARTGEVIDDVQLLAAGDAAAVWSLELSAESNAHASEAPIVQTFPGVRADFGVAWNVEPWYPK